MSFDLALFGAGAWGTALAVRLAPRMRVALWARDAAHAALLAFARRNARYLPGIDLPEARRYRPALAERTLIVATPASALDRRHGSPRRGRRQRRSRGCRRASSTPRSADRRRARFIS
jgi:glycerol-3-phosphate dehydrogenase